jgi:hypothetical protein
VLALCKALGVSCEAFTQEPAERERPGPGRPRKVAPAEVSGKAAAEPAKARTLAASPGKSSGKRKGHKGNKRKVE